MDKALIQIYSKPMMGGELPYFIGRQYGNGWLRTIGRIAFPILKRIAGVAANTAQDVILKEKPFLPALKANAIAEASNFINPSNPVRRRKRKTINKPNFPIKVRRR